MIYADKHIPVAIVQQMICWYRDNARNPAHGNQEVSELGAVPDIRPYAQGRYGVYVLYSAQKTLIYFGMSLSNVAARLDRHLSRSERASTFWATRPAEFAQTIFVPNPWEAPSLEQFLVHRAESYNNSEN